MFAKLSDRQFRGGTVADAYLYPMAGGEPHGYFHGKYVYSMAGECLYYRSGEYLYRMNGGQPVAYQSGKYFYAVEGGGQPLWYLS
jgi:hypothetical protein